MNQLKHIGGLPKALQMLIRTFLDSELISGEADPAIFEMSLDEIEELTKVESIYLQLIIDKKYDRWFLVAVGEYIRERVSDMLGETRAEEIKRSIVAFTPVDDAWIRSKKAEKLNYDKKKLLQNVPEYVESTTGARWV